MVGDDAAQAMIGVLSQMAGPAASKRSFVCTTGRLARGPPDWRRRGRALRNVTRNGLPSAPSDSERADSV